MTDIQTWLDAHGLGKYGAEFIAQDVTPDLLTDLSDAEDPEVPDAMRRAMGARPESAGSGPLFLADDSVGGIGAVIVVIAIVLVVADFVRGVIRRHNSDTALAAAAGRNAVLVLRAARFEASIRESSLSIGCLGSTIAFFGLVLVVFAVASVLAPGGQLASLTALSVVGVLVLSAWLFWWIRKRYPSPPASPMDRWAGRAVVGVILLVVVAFAVLALHEQSAPLSAEQEAWCLGPGAGYVDNAVGVLSIPRTWTSESAKDDPNFRKACGVAWDATHR